MLRRTHTDSSVDSSSAKKSLEPAGPSSRALQRTPKKLAATKTESIIDLTGSPGSTSSRSYTPSKSRSLEDALSPDKASSRPSLANSNVRTYAGKSRSFLMALPSSHALQDPLSQLTDIDDPTAEDDFETRESYADLRARWGVDNSEDDPYPLLVDSQSPSNRNKGKGKQQLGQLPLARLPPGMMNDLKSISELRSKGESRRFLDEVGYLFEGLAPAGALGVRRGSALEIVTKLCDPDFARRAKAADFLSRAWEGLRAAGAGDGDKILDTTLVLFAALVSRDPVDATDLATRTDFIPTLVTKMSFLTHNNDPLWLLSCGLRAPDMRSAGISRSDLPMLEGLQKLVRTRSGLFRDSEIVSNRLLASQALAALPAALHTSTCLPTMLSSMRAELEPLSARVSAYATGLPILPTLVAESRADFPSLSHIDNCLRLLDSYLLGRWEEDDSVDGQALLDSARDDGFGSTLVELCIAVDIISRAKDTLDYAPVAHKCLESAFRVLVNLTHGSLAWCEASIGSSNGLPSILRLLATCHAQRSQSSIAEHHEDDDTVHYLDRLCLILGLVTNLVQTSEEAKERIHDLRIATRCPGNRTCAVACRCPDAVNALQCLVQIYDQQCNAENDFGSVVRGHIAILFGLLMQGHPRNQVILLRLLPGPSRRKKVESVMENAREFTLLYAEFVRKASNANHVEEDGDDTESRDEDVDAATHVSHGETVVKQVLAFLENLSQSLDK
ncbi:hypothetical protein BC835DRAFT_1274905 [Cytidiella melzeri]|nr:hypothetical protein BC835DRAFT_1274905 [Cytidiella melzeri]